MLWRPQAAHLRLSAVLEATEAEAARTKDAELEMYQAVAAVLGAGVPSAGVRPTAHRAVAPALGSAMAHAQGAAAANHGAGTRAAARAAQRARNGHDPLQAVADREPSRARVAGDSDFELVRVAWWAVAPWWVRKAVAERLARFQLGKASEPEEPPDEVTLDVILSHARAVMSHRAVELLWAPTRAGRPVRAASHDGRPLRRCRSRQVDRGFYGKKNIARRRIAHSHIS